MPNLPAKSSARNGVMKYLCNREAWQDINLRKQGNSNKIQMATMEYGMYTKCIQDVYTAVYKMYTGCIQKRIQNVYRLSTQYSIG